MNIHAFIGATSGRDFFEATTTGMVHHPTKVATKVYETLINMGAGHLLRGGLVK